MSINKVPLTSGLPYQKNVDPSFETIAPNSSLWPTKTVTGKNVTPGRDQITGAIGQGLTGLIDLGFDTAGLALQDALGYRNDSVTGGPGVITDDAVRQTQMGGMNMGGMGMLPLLAVAGLGVYLLTR